MPPAQYTMSKDEKDVFLFVMKGVKVLDGYCSNIAKRVNMKERALQGLKSYDNHILIQQLLPISIRNCLSKNVVAPLIEWTQLVWYWTSEEAKKEAVTNARNCAMQGLAHRLGTRHITQVRHKLRAKGDLVDKMSVWMRSQNPHHLEVAAIFAQFSHAWRRCLSASRGPIASDPPPTTQAPDTGSSHRVRHDSIGESSLDLSGWTDPNQV
ncbi:hypothetical protein AAC387_Pa04g2537 [Persea americana]